MIELFKHILHLDFDWLFANYGMAIYDSIISCNFYRDRVGSDAIFTWRFSLFTAGLFARAGLLDMSYLLILLFIAAVLGDNCNYWIGRKVGVRIFDLKLKGRAIVKKEYLDKTHLFLKNMAQKPSSWLALFLL